MSDSNRNFIGFEPTSSTDWDSNPYGWREQDSNLLLFGSDPSLYQLDYSPIIGTPSGIRTHTVPSLNRMTLPIGLQEHIGTQGWT